MLTVESIPVSSSRRWLGRLVAVAAIAAPSLGQVSAAAALLPKAGPAATKIACCADPACTRLADCGDGCGCCQQCCKKHQEAARVAAESEKGWTEKKRAIAVELHAKRAAEEAAREQQVAKSQADRADASVSAAHQHVAKLQEELKRLGYVHEKMQGAQAEEMARAHVEAAHKLMERLGNLGAIDQTADASMVARKALEMAEAKMKKVDLSKMKMDKEEIAALQEKVERSVNDAMRSLEYAQQRSQAPRPAQQVLPPVAPTPPAPPSAPTAPRMKRARLQFTDPDTEVPMDPRDKRLVELEWAKAPTPMAPAVAEPPSPPQSVAPPARAPRAQPADPVSSPDRARALEKKVHDLERELERLRAEIERLRGEAPRTLLVDQGK